MPPSPRDAPKEPRSRPPATTPQARENQLVSLAVELAEKQLRNGNASSQVITHYLKVSSMEHKLQIEKLERENALLTAKVNSIASSEGAEQRYKDAIAAMSQYQGRDQVDEDY